MSSRSSWIERPRDVRGEGGGVISLISLGDLEFFFVLRSCHVDQYSRDFHLKGETKGRREKNRLLVPLS